MRKIVLYVLILICPLPAVATPCSVASARIVAAFLRRLARDTGNLVRTEGVDVALADTMSLGVPTGTVSSRVQDKAIRLWKHTENKIHRKCTDAEAAAAYPGTGNTTAEVTDDLFNRYGLPWVGVLRDMAGPYGARCAQLALVQAGYAGRDRVRRGLHVWGRYAPLVAHACPAGLFDDIAEISDEYLLNELDALRQ